MLLSIIFHSNIISLAYSIQPSKMPPNAKTTDRWVHHETQKAILDALPFLRIHKPNGIVFECIEDAKLLANVIDAIPTPSSKFKFTSKLSVIHRAILVFGEIDNDDFVAKEALKWVIADKVGCDVKVVRYYLDHRKRVPFDLISIEVAQYSIRVGVSSLSIVQRQTDGTEITRNISLTHTANHIFTTIIKPSVKLNEVTRKMIESPNYDSHQLHPMKVDLKRIAEETKEPVPRVRLHFERARRARRVALTDLTNTGKPPSRRSRASTQVTGGVLANISSGDTSADRSRNHSGESRLSPLGVGFIGSPCETRSGESRLSPLGVGFIGSPCETRSLRSSMSNDSLTFSPDE